MAPMHRARPGVWLARSSWQSAWRLSISGNLLFPASNLALHRSFASLKMMQDFMGDDLGLKLPNFVQFPNAQSRSVSWHGPEIRKRLIALDHFRHIQRRHPPRALLHIAARLPDFRTGGRGSERILQKPGPSPCRTVWPLPLGGCMR